MSSAVEKRRGKGSRWLIPLLCLLLPALAAMAPWIWERARGPRHPPRVELPPLRLVGDARRDRQAILERAAERLLPLGQAVPFPDAAPASRAALMGEIGVELLALDPAQGRRVVEQAIGMAASQHERVTLAEIASPERTRTGTLVRLARSLKAYPDLAEEALHRGYDMAQGNSNTSSRIFALSLFAQEGNEIDPGRARTALRRARAAAFLLAAGAPADPLAVLAAATARVEGAAAARPLVERAVQAIPAGRARPLVQARLAEWLAAAAPERASELARQAAAGIRIEPQRRAVATLLAATHPDAALATMAMIRVPGERVATLIDRGAAVEVRMPARAESLYRRALREAEALPPGTERVQLIGAAATALAAYDLATARAAVGALPGPAPAGNVLLLAARALKRQPEAARRLIESTRNGSLASRSAIDGNDDLFLAEVIAEPRLDRALALAQQGRSQELQAAALLAIARRLPAGRAGR